MKILFDQGTPVPLRRYQQNLSQRTIGIVVLMTTSWPRIRQRIQDVLTVVDSLPPSGYAEGRI